MAPPKNSKDLPATRSGYTTNDDRCLILFLKRQLEKGNPDAWRPCGNKLWEKAEAMKITDHSLQSMRDRMRRVLLKDLDAAPVELKIREYIRKKLEGSVGAKSQKKDSGRSGVLDADASSSTRQELSESIGTKTPPKERENSSPINNYGELNESAFSTPRSTPRRRLRVQIDPDDEDFLRYGRPPTPVKRRRIYMPDDDEELPQREHNQPAASETTNGGSGNLDNEVQLDNEGQLDNERQPDNEGLLDNDVQLDEPTLGMNTDELNGKSPQQEVFDTSHDTTASDTPTVPPCQVVLTPLSGPLDETDSTLSLEDEEDWIQELDNEASAAPQPAQSWERVVATAPVEDKDGFEKKLTLLERLANAYNAPWSMLTNLVQNIRTERNTVDLMTVEVTLWRRGYRRTT